MRRVVAGLLGASLMTSAGIAIPATASAAPPVEPPTATAGKKAHLDDLPNPLEQKRRELREQAVTGLLDGSVKTQKRGGSTVAKVGTTQGDGLTNRRIAKTGKDQYVELGREQTDRIFVILAEFGNERHPDYPDVDSDPATPGPTTFEGPTHNSIPQPNRAVDNSTVWQQDYNRDHYQELYFGESGDTLKTYYEAQSSGRYSVEGEVTDWVRVKYNEARYGRDCDINGNCTGANMWALVAEAANQWVADQKAAGRTDAEIKADVQSFDRHDRYDFDGDGNFNEADGYIDHFQIVHAGGDQSDGDPQQGEDAIWAHRSYAFSSDGGYTGPADNRAGGTQIGDTGIWIGDYTTQPENGGLSVFAHEYGHDLGLPDDYDTAGGSNNTTEFWSLMAQSRLNAAGEPLGTRPGDLGAWNKMQLGWLDYEIVPAANKRTLKLGPEEFNTADAQAAVVVLPDKQVTRQLGAPFAGAKQYFSGNANDLNNTMTREFDLTGATSAALTLKGRYNIEAGYDYLYIEGSADGTSWLPLDGTINGRPMGRDGSNRPAIDGSSGGAWNDIVVPLDAYAGDTAMVRFRYRTDGGVSSGGFFADDITVTAGGTAVFTDGAEAATTWTLKGFTVEGSAISKAYDHFYIAGNRSYIGFDRYLQTGPYNFGYLSTKPDWVEHFPYQQGLLISYNDTSYDDNNVSEHPGEGRNLYVDAHPEPLYNLDGAPWRARIQLYDAPFSLRKADSFTLHINGKPSYVRGQAAQPLFDDTRQHFFEATPWAGVKLPAVGVKIKVLEQDGGGATIQIN